MNAKLHHIMDRIIYHLYRTHKLSWASLQRKIILPASRCIKITDTANEITYTGTLITSYITYRHNRHRAAHLTQSIYNALIHTQREEKARQTKQPERAIIIATLPESKGPTNQHESTYHRMQHVTCNPRKANDENYD